MQALVTAYPGARVTLVTSPGRPGLPGAAELLPTAPWLAELVVYYGRDIRTLRQQWGLLRRLRQRNFDLWVELPSNLATFTVLLRNMLAARAAGAKFGCGWRLSTVRWGARAQALTRTFTGEVERLLQVLDGCGIRGRTPRFALPITGGHVAAVDRLLASRVPAGTPLAGVAPGAKRPANRWPLDRYSEVGRELARRGFFVLLLGGAGDRQACEQIALGVGASAFNAAGLASVLESAEILRRCAFVVCNDSGVQHLAAAVSTPCISIFGGRELPGIWHPYGENNVVLSKDVPCHPCFLDECNRDNLCLSLIPTSDVLGALDQLGRRQACRAT